MAMSRSLGERVLTTRSPMRMVPLEMSSSPATMRRAVLLPQPEGPTSTRNSPSAISRSRSWTAWNPLSYCLLTLSRMTSAMWVPLPCWMVRRAATVVVRLLDQGSGHGQPFTAPVVRPPTM